VCKKHNCKVSTKAILWFSCYFIFPIHKSLQYFSEVSCLSVLSSEWNDASQQSKRTGTYQCYITHQYVSKQTILLHLQRSTKPCTQESVAIRIYLACVEPEASHEVVCSYLGNSSPFLQGDHMQRSVTTVICTLEHNVCEDLVRQTRSQTPENRSELFNHRWRSCSLVNIVLKVENNVT